MKRTIPLLGVLLLGLSISLQAQAPQAIQYQTIIRNAVGEVVMNQSVGLQLTVRQTTATGTAVYQETHTKITNDYGLVNLQIGTGTTTDDFSAIDWSMGPYYLEVGLDLMGGSSYTVMGTTQLLSVPYALYAETAGSSSSSGGHYVGELIGDNGEDGIVFWVDHTGEHGLICSSLDLNSGNPIQWYNGSNVMTGATSHWDGNAKNTNAIITEQGAGTYAASICDSYDTPGTSTGDWYLPAINELSKLWDAKYEINKALNMDNTFQTGVYWSSTEFNSNFAWFQNFGSGNQLGSGKSGLSRVRAIRAF
jgi:hypothetical protein